MSDVEAAVAMLPYTTDQYAVLIRYREPALWRGNGAGQLNGWWLDSIWEDANMADSRKEHLLRGGW